jgi:hypothetical protein
LFERQTFNFLPFQRFARDPKLVETAPGPTWAAAAPRSIEVLVKCQFIIPTESHSNHTAADRIDRIAPMTLLS